MYVGATRGRENSSLTPSEENFDPEALKKILKGDGPNDKTSGNHYIKINAYTREGQKEITMLNKITNNDKFWDQPLEETYGELGASVHTKGVYKGWTLSIIEGL